MLLTTEAAFLEVRIRHLREEISAIDTRPDAIGDSLRGLPASPGSNVGPRRGTRGTPRICVASRPSCML